jgi:hypothetical protein
MNCACCWGAIPPIIPFAMAAGLLLFIIIGLWPPRPPPPAAIRWSPLLFFGPRGASRVCELIRPDRPPAAPLILRSESGNS